MKLFEIKKEIENLIDNETGEIVDIEKFAQLQIDEKVKIENWLLYIKNQTAFVEQLKAQETAFKARRITAENALERSKQQFAFLTNYEKFEFATGAVSYRDSERTEIDLDKLPKKYQKITYKADVATIKELLKKGEKVRGAVLVNYKNIQIK